MEIVESSTAAHIILYYVCPQVVIVLLIWLYTYIYIYRLANVALKIKYFV